MSSSVVRSDGGVLYEWEDLVGQPSRRGHPGEGTPLTGEMRLVVVAGGDGDVREATPGCTGEEQP